MPLRFLTVTHFFESHGGGIERVAAHLCRNLAAQGHECEWAASAADSAPAAVRGVAPALNPLREELQKLAERPVNFQATANFILYSRDVLFDEPFYTVIEAE